MILYDVWIYVKIEKKKLIRGVFFECMIKKLKVKYKYNM